MYLPLSDGSRCHFWTLSFKPPFSLSFLIERLFNSSLLSTIRVVSFAYLRFLIFLPAVLVPACNSSSLAFHVVYSAYKLNKQGDNIYSLDIPVCCSMSGSNCCFLTCIQVSQEAGKVVRYSVSFKNFPQFVVIHTVKGFSIVSEAKVDGFLEFSCFLYDRWMLDVYMYRVYPFICWWTFRLLPYVGCCNNAAVNIGVCAPVLFSAACPLKAGLFAFMLTLFHLCSILRPQGFF